MVDPRAGHGLDTWALWSMAFVPSGPAAIAWAWGTANLLSRWTCNHARISNEKPALLHLRARNWNRLVNLGKKKAGLKAGETITEESSFRVGEGMHRVITTPFVCNNRRSSYGKFLMMRTRQFFFFLLSNFYFTNVREESKRIFRTIYIWKSI